MSNELIKIADGLAMVADGVRSLAEHQTACKYGCEKNSVEDTTTDNAVTQEEPQPETNASDQITNVTIEEVRAIMAAKSQDGKTQQVKALLRKYGSEKLSGVQPEQYQALLADAKLL